RDNPPPSTHIYPLSLHDALPLCGTLRSAASTPDRTVGRLPPRRVAAAPLVRRQRQAHVERPIGNPGTLPHPSSVPRPRSSPRRPDRKSTRLNSSHVKISYAVFCL